MTASDIYRRHVDELTQRSKEGDSFARKTLFIIALLHTGWCYDPDETNVVDLASHKAKDIRQNTHSKNR